MGFTSFLHAKKGLNLSHASKYHGTELSKIFHEMGQSCVPILRKVDIPSGDQFLDSYHPGTQDSNPVLTLEMIGCPVIPQTFKTLLCPIIEKWRGNYRESLQ